MERTAKPRKAFTYRTYSKKIKTRIEKSRMRLKKNKAAEVSRITFITFMQSLYLTFKSYLSNNLFVYAAACTFGFLFSFIPIVMMILVVLIRFLHLSPESVTNFLSPFLSNTSVLNFDNFITSITEIHPITNFEIVLGFAIVYMARRFFSSVLGSLRKIFGKEQKTNSLFMQLVIIVGEVIIVVLISALIALVLTARTVIKFPSLNKIIFQFDWLKDIIETFFTSSFPLFLIFIVVLLAYKAGSRTKPPLFFCTLMSGGTTLVFWIYWRLMKIFLNVNKYNIIYGVLSNTIVLLSEIYVFFMVFLFFAQWLYVAQFFDTLLICELYLLPTRDDTSLLSTLKRILFIKPEFLLRRDSSVMKIAEDNFIYQKNDNAENVYYIFSGRVRLIDNFHISEIDKGNFIGVESCMIEEPRQEDAYAITDLELIKIPRDIFVNLIENAPEANKKALSQVSSYFVKTISRKNNIENNENNASKSENKAEKNKTNVEEKK